jgi:hypothetical protein
MRFAVVLLVVLAASGCTLFESTIEEQLQDAEEVGGQVFYLGDEYRGLPLVHVGAGRDDGNPHGADFVYGDCEPEGTDEPSCSPPLQVQNAVCPEGTRIVIYTNGSRKARRAAESLRPLGGGNAKPYEVRFDHATLCGT